MVLEESFNKLILESSNATQEEDSEIKDEEIGEKKFLTFITSDGEIMKVEEEFMLQSELIKFKLEDVCDNVTPLPNVTANIFTMVIDYCKHHVGDKEAEELNKWDDEFIDVDQKIVFDIIMAANYLFIKGLLDLACAKAAKIISGKPVPVIRELLRMESGFTEEEEEENRKMNPWAYED
ncbi:Skp1-related protein [Thalictrum thalictroides]|uniref:SKP1-like protein n=1 Tax=Thalictrum thalictroides TaxID=46969 RepID=A0A7J6X158_THATH|nr:Skp1-related protein [Thalictrum thalictroides]